MRCRLSVYLVFICSVLFKSIPFFFRINAYCCDLILWSPTARIFVIIQNYDVIIVINNNSIFFVQTIKVVPKHSVEFSVIIIGIKAIRISVFIFKRNATRECLGNGHNDR